MYFTVMRQVKGMVTYEIYGNIYATMEGGNGDFRTYLYTLDIIPTYVHMYICTYVRIHTQYSDSTFIMCVHLVYVRMHHQHSNCLTYMYTHKVFRQHIHQVCTYDVCTMSHQHSYTVPHGAVLQGVAQCHER